jgi:excisionase family DNA binding protein
MDGYMTIKDAAAYLKVHEETIRRWVKAGKLVAYKGEKIIRFKKEDLDKVISPIKKND